MEFEIGLTFEESSLLRNSLDVIQIQGKNARMVARLQDKLEEHIFQIQMNIQMMEEEKKQQEIEKIQQLEQIAGETILPPTQLNRGRKVKP